MASIQVPYDTAEEMGVFLDLEIADRNLVASFVPEEPPALKDVAGAAAYALEHPMGNKPLSELMRKGDKVVIITENQFRAAPAAAILPVFFERIKSAGGEVSSIAIGTGKVPPPEPRGDRGKIRQGNRRHRCRRGLQ
mgnify:CR=1 FL=1